MDMNQPVRFVQLPAWKLSAWICLLGCFGGVSMPTSSAQEVRDRDSVLSLEATPQGRFLPPQQRPPSNVKLGIYSRNTPTGVVVTRVAPNSLAEQSGIEAQDIILTVGGYQVGIVDGRTYDVSAELERRVDGQGRVTLLVLNNRNGRLVNIPLQFFESSLDIAGTVNTGSRQLVFPGMLLEVRLIDITHPQWRDVSLSETQLAVTGRWPMSFRLNVDPSFIRPNHRYAVEALVTHRGNAVLSTANPVPVNLNNATVRPALTLTPANRPPPSLPPVLPPTADSPIDQVDLWYQDFLGRELTSKEKSVWQRELSKGKSLEEILVTILGSSEYFDRFGGNTSEYISEVFRFLSGRNPSPSEMRRWVNRLAQLRDVRFPLVQEMMRELGR